MILKRLLIVFGILFCLPACETFQQAETIDVREPGVQRVYDLTNSGAFGGYSESIDPIRAASLSSDPNVQIFPLDGPVLVSGADARRSDAPVSVPAYVQDSNVQIFPLEPQRTVVQNPLRTKLDEVELTPIPEPVPTAYSSRYASTRDFVQPSVVTPAREQDVERQTPANGDLITRIYFGHDSAMLDATDREQIEEIAARFTNGSSGSMISVEGHASAQSSIDDPVRRRTMNMRVSVDRAYAVSKALVEAGVPAENIRTVAWGESKMSEVSPDQSRRVEIFSTN